MASQPAPVDVGANPTNQLRKGSATISTRKACANCRQQKIRCKSTDSKEPCERCRKMGIECNYEPRQERTRKRKDDYPDSREPLAKRRLLAQAPNSSGGRRNIYTASDSGRASNHDGAADYQYPSFQDSVSTRSASSTPKMQSLPNPAGDGASAPVRVLKDIHLEHSVVEKLFTIYFSHFHRYIPICDPSLTPDQHYAMSPTLFWCICAVASRRYDGDRNLMMKLAPKAYKLPLKTLFSANVSLPSIMGALILCTFCFPTSENFDEVPYVMSAALLHAAMKLGLFMPEESLDFQPFTPAPTEKECGARYTLWIYCHILYLRLTCGAGGGYGQLPRLPLRPHQSNARQLPATAQFQLDLQLLFANATTALVENGLYLETEDRVRALDIILRTYLDRLKDLEAAHPDLKGPEKVDLLVIKIMTYSFYLQKRPEDQDEMVLLQMYQTASGVVRAVDAENRSNSMALYCPYFVFAGTILATCILLRLLKSPFGDQVDKADGQELFFLGISLLQTMSTHKSDNPAKCAQGLLRLWRSERIFKNPDGSWNLELRNRNRLALSILYDVMRWSREESEHLQRAPEAQQQPQQHTQQQISGIQSSAGVVAKNTTAVPTAPMTKPPSAAGFFEPAAIMPEPLPFEFTPSLNDWWFDPNWSALPMLDINYRPIARWRG